MLSVYSPVMHYSLYDHSLSDSLSHDRLSPLFDDNDQPLVRLFAGRDVVYTHPTDFKNQPTKEDDHDFFT